MVLLLVGAATGGFLVTRHAVADQNRRVLAERAATIEASLVSLEESIVASLQVLGDIASTREPSALVVFNRVAKDQLLQATAVGATRRIGGRDVIVAGAGSARPGSPLSAAEASSIRRASTAHTFVASVLANPPRILLSLAVGDVVVFQESSLVPASAGAPQPATAAPYQGVKMALYANGRPVFATAPSPFHGVQVTRRLAVGADSWNLVVASDHSLVGAFTTRVPWFVLGAGLVTALLASVAVMTLVRRRRYALRLVAERTADLERVRAFQESLLLSGPVMVSRVTLPEGVVSYISPNTNRILGLDTTTLTGRHTHEIKYVHPDDRAIVEAAWSSVAEDRVPSAAVEFRVRTGTGDYVWVADVIVPDRDLATGGIVGVLSYVTDIEDRKTAEAGLRAAQLAAESANRAKSEFLSRMSHELRTPMNAVLGFGQLMEHDPSLNADQRESITYILKAGRHLLGLIDEILDISRIEAGTMSMSLEPVRPDRILAEALDLIRPLAEARNIELMHLPSAPGLRYVQADHQRLKQILLNLLSNAVKYNVVGGSVKVSASATSAATVRINVTDSGPGFTDEQRSLMFTPFERLGAEQGPVEGTGIGLVLSRHLAKVMGGVLELDSVPGQGSTFWVELPAAKTAEDDDDVEEDLEGILALTSSRPSVLNIEDNASNARLVERLLASRPDLDLLVTGRGRLGIDIAIKHRPGLVLLDLHLPDIPGEEVLRQLREHPATAQIPIVIVSADGSTQQRDRLLELGATTYLTKPFDVDELLDIIDGAMASR